MLVEWCRRCCRPPGSPSGSTRSTGSKRPESHILQGVVMSLKPSKTAVVTGGSRGLGRGIVKALVARGVRVIALARDKVGLDSLARELADGRRTPFRSRSLGQARLSNRRTGAETAGLGTNCPRGLPSERQRPPRVEESHEADPASSFMAGTKKCD